MIQKISVFMVNVRFCEYFVNDVMNDSFKYFVYAMNKRQRTRDYQWNSIIRNGKNCFVFQLLQSNGLQLTVAVSIIFNGYVSKAPATYLVKSTTHPSCRVLDESDCIFPGT